MRDPLTTSELFSDLAPNEARQLCYIAYYGEEYGSAIPAYLRKFHVSRTTYDNISHKLMELGYLTTTTHVTPKHHLDVLDYLSEIHPEWLTAFRQARQYSPTKKCEYLWNLSKCLRQDDFEAAARLYKPYEGLGHNVFNIYPYIRLRVIRDSRYCQLLDQDQQYTMTADTLETMLQEGTLDRQALESIRQMVTDGHPRRQEMLDRVNTYQFFVTGKTEDCESPSNVWALSLAGSRALYEGRVEDSLALFQQAATGRSHKVGALPSPLLNYLFAICILRYRIKYGPLAKQDVLSELRSSLLSHNGNSNFAAHLLLEYAEVNTEDGSDILQRHARLVKEYADTSLNRCLALLMARFFRLPDEYTASFADVLPSNAIMAHELSPYLATSSRSKEDLAARFGGGPLLPNIRKKESWEMLLGELDMAMEHKPDDRIRRIIYFLKDNRLSSILCQVQQEDLSWKDDEVLSVSRLCSDGYEFMDLADTRIASQLSHKEPWQNDTDILVPNLADTGKLFTGVEYQKERTSARITREDPYIDFSGQGDQILVTSNTRPGEDGLPRKHTVYYRDGQYFLVTLNPLQRDIMARLLKRRAFPASAAPSLRRTIESLKGIICVRENILSDFEQQAYESEGKVAVRIEPVDHEYQLTFLSAPMPEGTARLIPASGEEYVYDEDITGRTHCVHRNMEQEEDNYQRLVDFAEQYDAEFSGYNSCTIGDERILLSLLDFCHRYPERFPVEWPNGQVLKFKGILTESNVEIEVKSDENWFSVEGGATLHGERISLEQLLKANCRENYDGFIQIGENEYVRMTDTLRKHINELDAVLKAGEKPEKTAPKFLIGALARTLEGMNHSADDGYRDFMLRMKDAYQKDFEIPEGLLADLRPYQQEGFFWMSRMDAWGAGVCLADDMGLGKTLQAITFLLSKANLGPSLVVAPKSVIPNWCSEVERFAPSLKVTVLNDTHDRQMALEESGPCSLVLCTYGVLTTESDMLTTRKWNVVCLDEAHQIKNRNTQVSQAAMSLKAGSRLLLTGTPLQNHVGELWNLMQFLNPGMLGRWSVFRDTYVNAPLDESHRAMLKEMTQPFILRRTKQEVLKDLPEKIEGVHYVTMTDEETRVYEEMRRLVELKFKKDKTKQERVEAAEIDISYFEELMKLRLISCDIHLVYDLWKEQGSKLKALMNLLETLMDVPGNNILVFSQFTSFLSLVRDELKKRDMQHLYLDGQTSMKDRKSIVEQFQNGERRLFLSSLRAGGLGINLTAANYVILLDPWWNPAIENQATDRAHRLGQQRCVSVIRLISQHTIEEKILRLHEKKQQISDDMLSGTADTGKLTYEDILDMVTPF